MLNTYFGNTSDGNDGVLLRVAKKDRLLCEYGIVRDDARGRRRFAWAMEARCREETPESAKLLRRGWRLGGRGFSGAAAGKDEISQDGLAGRPCAGGDGGSHCGANRAGRTERAGIKRGSTGEIKTRGPREGTNCSALRACHGFADSFLLPFLRPMRGEIYVEIRLRTEKPRRGNIFPSPLIQRLPIDLAVEDAAPKGAWIPLPTGSTKIPPLTGLGNALNASLFLH